jgi:hypothetical protein
MKLFVRIPSNIQFTKKHIMQDLSPHAVGLFANKIYVIGHIHVISCCFPGRKAIHVCMLSDIFSCSASAGQC